MDIGTLVPAKLFLRRSLAAPVSVGRVSNHTALTTRPVVRFGAASGSGLVILKTNTKEKEILSSNKVQRRQRRQHLLVLFGCPSVYKKINGIFFTFHRASSQQPLNLKTLNLEPIAGCQRFVTVIMSLFD